MEKEEILYAHRMCTQNNPKKLQALIITYEREGNNKIYNRIQINSAYHLGPLEQGSQKERMCT